MRFRMRTENWTFKRAAMRHLSFLLLLSMSFSFSTCRDEEELPPITMEGKNTFGCKVNGNLWVPKGRLGQSAMLVQMQSSGDTIGINIYADDDNTTSGITISIFDNPNLKVNHPYSFKDQPYHVEFSRVENGIVCFYENVVSGSITLSKFEPNENVISGTFEFTVLSSECTDTIKITEGRFDISEINY